ncbi:MAG TPA: hypothetical protein VFA26_04390, partial [Gemmataceae bacterium]|nr:hypothetical protein [Gemmataceae bacterium]
MRRRLAPVRWLPLLAALLCAACSSGLHPVRGKVTYQGQPARGAVVTFHPRGDDGLTAVRPSG